MKESITTDTEFRVTDNSDGSVREAKGTIELEDLLKDMFDGASDIAIVEHEDGTESTVGDCIQEIIKAENRDDDFSDAESALNITVQRL